MKTGWILATLLVTMAMGLTATLAGGGGNFDKLTDADRQPWLELLNGKLRGLGNAVLACSALKESYRKILAQGLGDCRFVHLRGSIELIRARLAERKHRYMPASLLESQFATLEPPVGALAVDIAQPPAQCVEDVCAALR